MNTVSQLVASILLCTCGYQVGSLIGNTQHSMPLTRHLVRIKYCLLGLQLQYRAMIIAHRSSISLCPNRVTFKDDLVPKKLTAGYELTPKQNRRERRTHPFF